MAHEGGSSILPIVIIGGVGYWLYSSGILSSLFGSSAPAPAPAATTPPAGGTNPVAAAPAPPTPPAPNVVAPPPPCSPSGILAPLLADVQKAQGSSFGAGLPGTLTIDQWGYYLNQRCSGMADQYKLNADTLFPGRDDRGGPLNWSAFAGYAQQAGLSAVNPRNRGRRVGRRLIGTNMVRRVA